MEELTLTVAVASRNRPHELERALLSIVSQTAPPQQIIVVDDSEPDRRAEVDDLLGRLAHTVLLLRKDQPGLPASRNLAADHATGALILFIDDDVVLHPGYCAALTCEFADPAVKGVGGVVCDEPAPSHKVVGALLGLPGRRTGRILRSGWPSGLPTSTGDVEYLSGCNMAYRTALVRDLRFDEATFGRYGLGEDLEFSYRVSRTRGRLRIAGDAFAWHLSSPPAKSRDWGRMEVEFRRVILGERLSIPRFLLASLSLAAFNRRGSPERARGNLQGLRNVVKGRPILVVLDKEPSSGKGETDRV